MGGVKIESKPLFPGYVFLETSLKPDKLTAEIKPVINGSGAMIRLLRDDKGNALSVPDEERRFFENLWGQGKCVEASEGVIDGERVTVTRGALAGREAIIRHINRHKMEAALEISFFGTSRRVNVGLEVAKKS